MAAILFPVFAKAREKARQTSCLSNLKQVALAVLQYAQDYDEKLVQLGHNPPLTYWWYDDVTPYIKNTQVFSCPSMGNSVYGIGYNAQLSAYWSDAKSLGAIQSPSATIMLADSLYGRLDYAGGCYGNCAGFYTIAPANVSSTTPYTGGAVAATRHNGGANFAYIDGHAKWNHWKEYQFDPVKWQGL